MHAIDAPTHTKWLFIVVFVTVGAFILTACGTNTSNNSATGTASTPSPTPSTTPTVQTVRGYGTAYGCPGDVVVSNAPAPANVIVRPGKGQTTFSVQPGDVLEVQMPFGIAWRSQDVSGSVIQLQSPSGYVSKPDNACIWRYVAKGTGAVKLTFTGTVLCKQNLHCVLAEMIDEFTIKVA
ncbi:MAG TPA: hypothetical protein VFQ36_15230 [Ktedonobacteraceae bacterium]|nr:hypothetical protein [Ktedonobacteraceae bacterium]